MIELRTLGALELRGADGGELRRVLEQPKRLALLAYLAVATPRRFHRRDALLAIFWPELDTEHARGALRRSLYFLRRVVGENVIVGRGDEEVGLAPGALWCDTAAFETLLAEGRRAEAIALYRGALLEGFYITGAPEFERWLESERARLLALATASGWTFAEQLATEAPDDAAQWARRIAEWTPHDEAAYRRLVTLLARVGDRTGALRAYDDFAKRLRASFDVEPSAETRALIATLRAAPAMLPPRGADSGVAAHSSATTNGPSPDAPPHAPTAAPSRERAPAVSPNVVAVLPFSVRGGRDLAYLGEGMVDLLSTTLDGAGELRAVDPRALLGHLAREEGVDLDPEQGRVIATHFGAGLYVLGNIVAAGSRIRLHATLYDAAAAPLARADVTGSSEQGLFDMVDSLARALLGRQETGPGARLTNLAARTTECLPALKAYLRGECEFRAGRYFQALDSFQNAAAEDTGFALAWYRLAAAAAATANLPLAREASEQAHQSRDRVAAHDRLLIDAQGAWLRGAADEAERLYAAALSTHVDDIEAWFLLGDVLFHHNPRRGRPMAEARAAFERALGYEPDHLSSLVHLARIAAFEGRDAELEALVKRVLALSPVGDRALSVRALRAFALRNEIEKARILAALGRARALAVGIAFTDIVLFAHDLPGAYRLARIVTKLTPPSEAKALCHVVAAHLDIMRGRVARAHASLARAAAFDAPWALEVRGLFALLPFRAVPAAECDAVARELRAWDAAGAAPNRNQALAAHNGVHPVFRHYLLGCLAANAGQAAAALDAASETERAAAAAGAGGFGEHLAQTVRALVAGRAGHNSEALGRLEHAQPEVWYQLAVTSPFFACAFERYLRAELLRSAGRLDEALDWYATLGQSSPYELAYLAPAHLRQAEICESLGRRDRAAEHRRQATSLWAGCDAELGAFAKLVPVR